MRKHLSSSKKSISHEAQMRQTIKEGAFELMAQKGLDKVSMREIAQKLHVTKPVLYYYFKNKEDLCRCIIEGYTKGFEEWLSRLWENTHCVEEVVKQVCQIQRRFYTDNANRSRFVIQMLAYSLGSSAKPLSHRKTAGPHILLQKMLQREVKKENWPPDAIADISTLVSALSADMALSVYYNQHLDKWLKGARRRGEYTAGRVDRLVQIMLLGIKAYYRGKK